MFYYAEAHTSQKQFPYLTYSLDTNNYQIKFAFFRGFNDFLNITLLPEFSLHRNAVRSGLLHSLLKDSVANLTRASRTLDISTEVTTGAPEGVRVVGSGTAKGVTVAEYMSINVIFTLNLSATLIAVSKALFEWSEPSKGTRIFSNEDSKTTRVTTASFRI